MKCACILAAGTGSRLKKYTQDRTKCMVSVGGVRLIDHTISSLLEGGVETIFIVVGFCGDDLVEHVRAAFPKLDVRFILNDVYATTNNIYSLKLALPDLFEFDEVVLVESDLWIEHEIAANFVRDTRENVVLVSPFRYWMDGTCVTIDSSTHMITGFVAKADIHLFASNPLYKTVNWYKFSGAFLREVYSHFINAYVQAFGRNAYYEDVLKVIASGFPKLFTSYVIEEQHWMEVDDEEDLSRAELLAEAPKRAAEALVQRFGGFWKFPFIEDLTLLVNPFFPTSGMMDELSRVLNHALREYPSNLSAVTRVAAKSVSCESDQIVVGNGASELMMALFAEEESRQYVIAPPFFLEYQRLLGDRLQLFSRTFPDTSLESALVSMVESSARDIILVNPNNPTGELCRMSVLMELLPKLKKEGRRLILDESFMDFAAGEESLLKENVINLFPNLVILKSFGKSYGVPGLRLGIAASADVQLVGRMRSRLPIWNISSAAEVFLDMLPRYKKEYQNSLIDLRRERDFFERVLKEIGIEYYTSHANFVFFRLAEKKGNEFGEHCFKQGLLVKKIVGRDGLQGVCYRIAVRTREQNLRVVGAVREYID